MRARTRAAKPAASAPPALAIHWSGPTPANVTYPRETRRGPSGSTIPKAVLTALISAKCLPCLAVTLAKAKSVRSSITRPVPPARPYWPGTAMPERAELSARLTMQPRSFRIEEHRTAYFHFDIAATHRIVGAHALADAL